VLPEQTHRWPAACDAYPACKDWTNLRGLDEDEDLLEESYVEHDSAKVLIAELLDSESDAEFYEGNVTVLSEMIKHHVKEEETRREGLFAPAKRGPVWIPIPWGGACRRQGGPVVTENPIPAGLAGGMSYGSARCSTS
jgi:hypothetical protein